MKLKVMYLLKSLTSRTALNKRLYRFRMEDSMNLRVYLGAFNTLVRDVFNEGGKIEEEDQACLFMTSQPKSYDPITISLLGKKSDQTMSEVTVVLLNFESLRQYEEDVSGYSSALVTASDWRQQKRSGRGTCHKCGKPGHFRQDCPERRMDRPPTPEARGDRTRSDPRNPPGPEPDPNSTRSEIKWPLIQSKSINDLKKHNI
jgi:gag-polypeptide of LTR copia-type/Zinc knuckle